MADSTISKNSLTDRDVSEGGNARQTSGEQFASYVLLGATWGMELFAPVTTEQMALEVLRRSGPDCSDEPPEN
ncbi:hypothetical protein GCM10008957_47230 [Deinococcus ruber]|uniref:Uncharacterized protein n=1 Tax=Deinococcus ruber TaxID=1848197 RepID=A0A918CNS3_9DEIO|nr:hypothetical protein GCM10008957_47230 [Deinococcus ruber]